LIPSTDELKIKNFTTQIDAKKSVFSLNQSWKENINKILDSSWDKTSILVNGVQNAGKSTFISTLINNFLTRTKKSVFVLDLDPGQPNYNLAG
jgi:polynucleotide 5'-kinase involved in rRNA processing